MDQISIHFQNCLDRLAVSRSSKTAYWNMQQLFHQYLVNALRAEIWWRLQSLGQDPTMKTLTKRFVQDLSSYRYEQPLTTLADCLQAVFSGNPEQLDLFDRLLQLLDGFAQLRNTPLGQADPDTLCDSADGLLEQIDALRDEGIHFPPLSDNWEMIIPLSLEAGHWDCVVYQQHSRRRSVSYLWSPMRLPADTLEYNDGPDYHSPSCISCGRVYFRSGTRMRCLYPFVQAGFNSEENDTTSIWVLQQLERLQNGECSGADLYKSPMLDYRNIPEFIMNENDASNPYITFTGPQDSEGNFYPLRNRYNTNYPDWCSSLDTINNTIGKLKKNLNTPGCSLIYLYGSGGVGKTAAVQKLLEEYDVPKKRHDFDHIIFLSAKKYVWNPTNGPTKIEYDDSKGFQCFIDLPTLRSALRNILGGARIRECAAGTDDWNMDYEHLYSGKSILLVLDDFESVEKASQAEIIAYLEHAFYASPAPRDLLDPHSGFKRRQVIITSRDSSIECLRSDIMLSPLNTDETVCLALHFAKRFHCLDAYRSVLGHPGCILSDAQQRNRRRFRDTSRGKPLMILSLVHNYPEAQFLDSGMTEKELLEMLTRDNYSYFSRDDLCLGLAVLAAYLARDGRGNTLERLQYLFEKWDTSNTRMEHCLQLLLDYLVIELDRQERTFTFTSRLMYDQIRKDFKKDSNSIVHFTRSQQRLAKWLQSDQELSIQECLANRLQRQLEDLFVPGLADVEPSDITTLVEAVFLDTLRNDCPRWKLRRTLHMVVSACGRFTENLRDAGDSIPKLISEYPGEVLWMMLYEMPSDFPIDDNPTFSDIVKAQKDCFSQCNDPYDRFVQLWCALRMIGVMRERGLTPPADWGDMVRSMMLKCRGALYLLSKEDLNLLTTELRLAQTCFGSMDFCLDDLDAAKYMEGRDSTKALFFAE